MMASSSFRCRIFTIASRRIYCSSTFRFVDSHVSLTLSLIPCSFQPTGMTGAGNEGTTQANEPVSVRHLSFAVEDRKLMLLQDGGTLNGVGQWGSPLSTSYSNYTLSPSKTYRLRLSNTGSFAAVRFSVDSHVLTVVEADGTPVVPYKVTGLVIDVAQRYSVLLTTNQTSGAYWMRSTVQEDAFTVSHLASLISTCDREPD